MTWLEGHLSNDVQSQYIFVYLHKMMLTVSLKREQKQDGRPWLLLLQYMYKSPLSFANTQCNVWLLHCVRTCVFSSGFLHGCESSFSTNIISTCIHSKAHLVPCKCICFIFVLDSDHSQTTREKKNSIFTTIIFFFFFNLVRYHQDVKDLLWIDYTLAHNQIQSYSFWPKNVFIFFMII